MQHARIRQADILLVKINNDKSMHPAASLGEERGILSRTVAGNQVYSRNAINSLEFRRYQQSLSLLLIIIKMLIKGIGPS